VRDLARYIGNYIEKQVDGTIILQSPMLLEFSNVRHAFTTRQIIDAQAKEKFSELNMSLNSPDFPEHFEFFAKAFGINPRSCVFSHQTHSKNIKVVNHSDINEPYWERKVNDIDGLITSEPGIFLVTTYADCMPIVAYDSNRKIVGVAHSGWRGTLLEIAKELILKMNEEFNCSPQDIFVTVGPSIGPESFEVGSDVASEFSMKFGKRVVIERSGRFYVDLWKAVEISLSTVGIMHLEFSNIDTYKTTEYFYSYRKEKTKKRFAAIVGIIK